MEKKTMIFTFTIFLLNPFISFSAPVAPAPDGSTGLYRIHSAFTIPKLSFSISTHGNVLYSTWRIDPDLALNLSQWTSRGTSLSSYSYTELGGSLAFSIAPLSWLECGIKTSGSSAEVKEPSENIPYLQKFGDMGIFGKSVYQTEEGMNIGGEFEIFFPTRVNRFMWEGDAITVNLRALWSMDLNAFIDFPFRVHLNIGYRIDNTKNVINGNYELTNSSIKYFYNIKKEGSIIGGAAIEFPTDDVTLFLEYFTSQMIDRSWNDNSQLLTPGVRITPLQGLSIDIGADLSMSSLFNAVEISGKKIVNEPLWNVFFGVSYVFLPPSRIKVEKTEAPPPPTTGRLKGKVVEAETSEPVGDAIIEFVGTGLSNIATDPVNGTFTSWELPAGEIEIIARKEGYAAKKVTVLIKAGTTVEEKIELEKEKEVGMILGKVTDPNNVPLPAIIGVKNMPDLPGSPVNPSTGTFQMSLPPGLYSLIATAEGYIEAEKTVEVRNRAKTVVEFILQPVPKPVVKAPPPPPPPSPPTKPMLVELKREKGIIEIKKTILFELGKAKLLPVSFEILDEVAKILVENPDLKIRIEGHTDSTGSRNFNIKLSQGRAEAVRDYLIKKGISPDRLIAIGYGPDKPIADNKTPEGRARNRRVEFHIIQ